jgi:transcriptional regulator with XRE-family HTH domain
MPFPSRRRHASEVMSCQMVDEASVRAPRAQPELGRMCDRLRRARREQGLSQRDLAVQAGVSPSLISQVERGRASPSVATLYAIVTILDLSLDEVLFAPPGTFGDERGHDRSMTRRRIHDPEPVQHLPEPLSRVTSLQRAHDRKRIRLASGVTWERLTTTSEPGVEFLAVTYEVGGASSSADAFQRHSGHEWGYVLSGSLHVTIGFEDHLLGPGDAISIDSSIPHRLWNDGTQPVHGIWFVLGRDDHGTRSLTRR